MTEVVSCPDVEPKRRLPTWMLRPSAKEQTASENDNETRSLLEEIPRAQAAESKAKSVTRKCDGEVLSPKRSALDALESLEGYSAKRKSRTLKKRDEGSNSVLNACEECNAIKRKRRKKEIDECKSKLHEGAIPSEKKLKADRPIGSETKAPARGTSEDEVELSVEDLKSIAEEYVNGADLEDQHSRLATGKPDSGPHQSSSFSSFKYDSWKCITVATKGIQTLSRCTSSQKIEEIDTKKEKAPVTESCGSSILRTRDAAQDMLDLLLGPLLKKRPPEQEQGAQIDQTDSMFLEHESSKVRNRTVPKEEKKKGSLKDKVALYLV